MSDNRGKKQCPKCQTYVGVRTKICQCAYNFCKNPVVSVKQQKEEEKKKELPPVNGVITIYYPAGKCPFRLDSLDEDTVRDWIYRVVEHGLLSRRNYTVDALIYFAREFYPVYTKEFKDVQQTILDILRRQPDENTDGELSRMQERDFDCAND